MSLQLTCFVIATILAVFISNNNFANAASFQDYSTISLNDQNDYVKVCTIDGQRPVCYSNWYGNFHFKCNNYTANAPRVDIIQCSDVNCTSNCQVKNSFYEADQIKYAYFRFVNVNWTGVVYHSAPGAELFSRIDFENAGACRLDDIDDQDHYIADSNICVKGSISSVRYGCGAGGTTPTRYVYSFNDACTGTAATYTYGNGNASCATNSGYYIYNCSDEYNVLRAIVFRKSGAGAISAFLAVVLMALFVLIF
jgi:hypothetical protein